MPPKIEFYYAPGACSLAPHILLHVTAVAFTGTPMRVSEARTEFPASFTLLNPKNQVPVLVLSGTAITEVPAVCTAISAQAPDMHLMGRTALDTARVYEWMAWLSGTLHGGGFGHLFRPQRWTTSAHPAVLEGIAARARERVEECFVMIEGKLKMECEGGGEGVFAVGGALTAVDPYLFVFYRWGNNGKFGMKEKYPRYTALVDGLLEMDAVVDTLVAEGIESTL